MKNRKDKEQEPYKVDGGGNGIGKCKCGRVVNYTMNYCPKCGVRIEVRNERI